MIFFSNPVYLATAIVLVFLVIFLNNFRWRLLLNVKGFQLSNIQSFRLTLIGVFFNFALPGGIGGDIVKGYYLIKGIGDRKTVAATTLLMDRLMGMFGLVSISVLMVIVSYPIIQTRVELKVLAIAIVGLFIFILVLFLLAFSTVLKEQPFFIFFFEKLPGGTTLKSIHESIYSYRDYPWVLFQTFGLSVAAQFLIIVFVWFFAQITSAPEVSILVYCFIVSFGLLTFILPVTPAGIGVGQAAFYYLYELYTGVENQVGPNAITAYQLILLAWGLLGAYCYIKRDK